MSNHIFLQIKIHQHGIKRQMNQLFELMFVKEKGTRVIFELLVDFYRGIIIFEGNWVTTCFPPKLKYVDIKQIGYKRGKYQDDI